MTNRTLAWGAKVSPDFRTHVYNICKRFSWTDEHASWLMACMAFESAETFSPSICNAAGSGAVGLVQFMPKTAWGLGTTPQELVCMTPEAQLKYVEAYFKPYAARVKSLPDMYMAILMPKYIGKPDDTPIFSGGVAYRQNSGLDANKDGKVTKAEAAAKVTAKLARGSKAPYLWVE